MTFTSSSVGLFFGGGSGGSDLYTFCIEEKSYDYSEEEHHKAYLLHLLMKNKKNSQIQSRFLPQFFCLYLPSNRY